MPCQQNDLNNGMVRTSENSIILLIQTQTDGTNGASNSEKIIGMLLGFIMSDSQSHITQSTVLLNESPSKSCVNTPAIRNSLVREE